MASTTTPTLPSWEALDALSDGSRRFIDLCAIFRRNDKDGNPTGELLLEVGGQWDRTDKRYTGNRPKKCKTWGVNEAQLEIVDDIGTWIVKRRAGDDSRNIIISAGGPRGSGKTHVLVYACAALNLFLPGSKAWVFNPTLDKREEIEDLFRAAVPKQWAANPLRWPTSIPDCRFRLINGSSTRSLSGEIPEGAKRGEAEFIALNEAQQQRRKVYSLSLYGIRKRGGLMMLAHNPPTPSFPAGEWVIDLMEKIDAGKIAGTSRILDPRLNPSVDSATMAKIGDAISEVDPDSAGADVAGRYERLGEFAYGKWVPTDRMIDGILHRSMVVAPPDIGDITSEALRKAGVFSSFGVAIGTDHQTTPHQAAAAIKVFRGSDGKNNYYVTDEIIVSGSSVTEVDLSDALYNGLGAAQIEYTRDSAILIVDCSGDWQVSNRQSGMTSIKVLESQLWRCKPPTEIKRPDRSLHPKNPPVHHSLAQMADVMREGRFFVAPHCKWVIEALSKTPLKKSGDRVTISQAGGYAHVCDAIRYVIWLLEPKRVRKTAPPVPGSMRAISISHSGPRVL
jgi:hypothetical protein